MSGGTEGPPDLVGSAQSAAQNLYHGGSEKAAAVSTEAELLPFKKALADVMGGWGVRAQQAGQGNQLTRDREKATREAAGTAAAIINQSPANLAFQAFQDAFVQVKDQTQAEALMKQMTSISNQLEQVGKNALSTGAAMGGDPQALQAMIEAQIYDMQRKLQEQYKELLSKYYTNAPPGFRDRLTPKDAIPYDPLGNALKLGGFNPYQE
jgi:DNA-binding protein YbaB